jgi:hypothetical protein
VCIGKYSLVVPVLVLESEESEETGRQEKIELNVAEDSAEHFPVYCTNSISYLYKPLPTTAKQRNMTLLPTIVPILTYSGNEKLMFGLQVKFGSN